MTKKYECGDDNHMKKISDFFFKLKALNLVVAKCPNYRICLAKGQMMVGIGACQLQ
jgi:hypothetical protein